jgi:hypothetical protein
MILLYAMKVNRTSLKEAFESAERARGLHLIKGNGRFQTDLANYEKTLFDKESSSLWNMGRGCTR